MEYSAERRFEDADRLPLDEYIAKYYCNPEVPAGRHDWKARWDSWMSKFVDPLYDEATREGALRAFGYKDVSKFGLSDTEDVYAEVAALGAFSRDVARFVGFMAGNGFFDRGWELDEWLRAKNWSAPPHRKVPRDNGVSPLGLTELTCGENYLRANLTLLPFWHRG